MERVIAPEQETLKALAGWRPPNGVISVYVNIDHADRGEGWRIALKDELAFLREQGERVGLEHDPRKALNETLDRIAARFPPDAPPPDGRLQIGFCEVSLEAGREEWTEAQFDGVPTRAAHLDHPLLCPLAAVIDDGAPLGVALVSAEKVRLLEWSLGDLAELEDWEAVFYELDWRERKAQKPSDPKTAQGTTAAGSDQYAERLEANRERFLKETGARVDSEAQERNWRAVLAFGDPAHVRELVHGGHGHVEMRQVSDANLISEDLGSLQERVDDAVDEMNRERELQLVEHATNAALATNGRGLLGKDHVATALQEARVDHLIVASEIAEATVPPDERPPIDEHEALIEQAIATGAKVTPVEGRAAEALSEHEGVAALLRY